MDEKDTVKSLNRKRIIYILVIIVIIAICGAAFSLVYSLITQRIIDNSIKNIEEVAKHDGKSIMSNLQQRWNYSEGIATEIEEMNITSIKEMYEKLKVEAKTINARELFLISSSGDFYSSDKDIKRNEDLFDICKDSQKHFACYYLDNDEYSGDNEVLFIGTRVTPFYIDNIEFEYIAYFYDTALLVNEVEINLYNGRGSSNVVDLEGNYIVYIHRSEEASKINNYFTAISTTSFTSNIEIDEIKRRMSNQEFFYLEYSFGNVQYIMSFSPLENMNWYFVESVPRSIFEEQSKNIIDILVFLLLFIMFGIIIIVVLILRNTSQRKLMGVELTHRNELESALHLAEQASRAKTVFLNNMSHDIRTPMNAIIGFTNLANMHLDDKEQAKDYLDKIMQSSNHLLSLINDVLDMSRIESGKVTLEEKEENIAEILHSLKDIIQADIEAKQLAVYIDTINVVDEFIYCDKLRLNQVLLNLLSNAIKFTPIGGTISLLVTQKKDNDEMSNYEFRIKDTGIGISKEFMNVLFDPFTRERNSTVSGIQGTGLGMSIVKNIIDMMNGTIEVESEVGKGTEFIVNIKFKTQNKNQEMKFNNKLKDIHSLIIANDVNTCKGVSGILDKLNVRNDIASSAEEAINIIKDKLEKNDSFTLFFVEWQMKNINGIEVATYIRKLVGKDMPIVLVSVYDFSSIRSEAVNCGITDFLSKPVFMSDIVNLLNKHYSLEKNEDTIEEKEIEFKNKRILLVEDNMMNREIATEYLTDFGFLVESAENGKVACDILKDAKPGYFDLVLMDIQMPIMNGYEATKTIRQFENKEIANIPIIAMTANVFEEDKKLVQDSGMNGFLGKPIDIPELINVLKKIL